MNLVIAMNRPDNHATRDADNQYASDLLVHRSCATLWSQMNLFHSANEVCLGFDQLEKNSKFFLCFMLVLIFLMTDRWFYELLFRHRKC